MIQVQIVNYSLGGEIKRNKKGKITKETAKRAYLSCGFVEKDKYVKANGVAVVSMEKDLGEG